MRKEVAQGTGSQCGYLNRAEQPERQRGKYRAMSKLRTHVAREMLLAGNNYSEIEQVTALRRETIRSLRSKMRDAGQVEGTARKVHYTYIGRNDAGQKVEFVNLGDASAQGFHGPAVSAACRGLRDSYAGYTWRRVAAWRPYK